MIKSMTGFGRCEIADEKRKFTVELKSVNHRYLDVNLKMPKKLNFFEIWINIIDPNDKIHYYYKLNYILCLKLPKKFHYFYQ